MFNMWIELKDKETLLNLDTGNEITLGICEINYTFYSITRNSYEYFKNQEQAQARYEEIKGMLIPQKKKINNEYGFTLYHYQCSRCHKNFDSTKKIEKYFYCHDCVKELNNLIGGKE